uniref:PAM2 domain-containing protein n=1 Tax=Globodera pallida TaxID=36090 RepID=A0A183CE58_GLOPA
MNVMPSPRQYTMPPYPNQPQLIPQQPPHGMYLAPITATAPAAQPRYVDTAVPMPPMRAQQQMVVPYSPPHNNSAAPMLPHHPTPF